MYKTLFEFFTDPLSLPFDPIIEHLILLLIGWIAYQYAYQKVGVLYAKNIIVSRNTGSFLHWLIRLFVFMLCWAAICLVVYIFESVLTYWQVTVSILAITLSVIIVTIILWKINNKATASAEA